MSAWVYLWGMDYHSPGWKAVSAPGCFAMVRTDIERLRTAHATVAKLVVEDLVYLPVFERLDAELKAAEARATGDAIAYARAALRAQNAKL